jgi:hypothetical protein
MWKARNERGPVRELPMQSPFLEWQRAPRGVREVWPGAGKGPEIPPEAIQRVDLEYRLQRQDRPGAGLRVVRVTRLGLDCPKCGRGKVLIVSDPGWGIEASCEEKCGFSAGVRRQERKATHGPYTIRHRRARLVIVPRLPTVRR